MLDNQLEAVLFQQSDPIDRSYLTQVLGVSADELDAAVRVLTETLANRGIRLLQIGEQLELITAPEVSEVVAKVRKAELVKDLGKAGSETLSIILYRGPISRARIEYIRGVHCSFVLRNLLIRGLIERVPNPAQQRSVLYDVTPAFLTHMGVTRKEDLPQYQEMLTQISVFEARQDSVEQEEQGGGHDSR